MHKVANETSVSEIMQDEKTASFWKDHWLPSGCVYMTLPGWKTLESKNSRTCMMNIAIARSRIGTKNLSERDNLY